MAKRILVLGATLMMCLGLFAGCEKYAYQEGDFELTISVENTTVQQGEDFVVEVNLKNQSGRKFKCYYNGLPISAYLENWRAPYFADYFNDLVIKNNGYYHETWCIGANGYMGESSEEEWPSSLPLAIGTHELKFMFWIPQQDTALVIWSNTVTLTVE